ncbi:TPA: Rrf2 family transcriptional regulator [Bacillus pacificus]|nr:Rrf2 family transcriptional regulator [Bacillus pacificus]
MAKLVNSMRFLKALASAEKRLTLKELANKVNVKERMVRIYITEFKEAGLNIKTYPGQHGGIELDEKDLLDFFGINQKESEVD